MGFFDKVLGTSPVFFFHNTFRYRKHFCPLAMHLVGMFSSISITKNQSNHLQSMKNSFTVPFTANSATSWCFYYYYVFIKPPSFPQDSSVSWSLKLTQVFVLKNVLIKPAHLTFIKQDQKCYCVERTLWLAKNSFFSSAVELFYSDSIVFIVYVTTDSANIISRKRQGEIFNAKFYLPILNFGYLKCLDASVFTDLFYR